MDSILPPPPAYTSRRLSRNPSIDSGASFGFGRSSPPPPYPSDAVPLPAYALREAYVSPRRPSAPASIRSEPSASSHSSFERLPDLERGPEVAPAPAQSACRPLNPALPASLPLTVENFWDVLAVIAERHESPPSPSPSPPPPPPPPVSSSPWKAGFSMCKLAQQCERRQQALKISALKAAAEASSATSPDHFSPTLRMLLGATLELWVCYLLDFMFRVLWVIGTILGLLVGVAIFTCIIWAPILIDLHRHGKL